MGANDIRAVEIPPELVRQLRATGSVAAQPADPETALWRFRAGRVKGTTAEIAQSSQHLEKVVSGLESGQASFQGAVTGFAASFKALSDAVTVAQTASGAPEAVLEVMKKSLLALREQFEMGYEQLNSSADRLQSAQPLVGSQWVSQVGNRLVNLQQAWLDVVDRHPDVFGANPALARANNLHNN